MNRPTRVAALTVFVIAALAAGRAVTDALPTEKGELRGSVNPFIVEGQVGEPADLRYAEVTVDRVRPARGFEGITDIESTPGRFVVVDTTIVARDVPRVLGGFTLLAEDGRRFHADGRWPIGGQPAGIPWHVTGVFEVPTDAIQGAVLEVALSDDWWSQRRDQVLHVDLGIGKIDAEEYVVNRDLLARPENGLEPPELEPVGEVPDALIQD